MKLQIVVDKTKEESVLIVCHDKNELVCKIEKLITSTNENLSCYKDDEIRVLNLEEVACFITDDNKVYAYINKDKYLVKKRIYELEELLDNSFLKINQGCLANIKQIEKFVATIQGSLDVIFKNGYREYVSRRQLHIVKERLGI